MVNSQVHYGIFEFFLERNRVVLDIYRHLVRDQSEVVHSFSIDHAVFLLVAAMIKISYCVKIHMEQEIGVVMSNPIQKFENFCVA